MVAHAAAPVARIQPDPPRTPLRPTLAAGDGFDPCLCAAAGLSTVISPIRLIGTVLTGLTSANPTAPIMLWPFLPEHGAWAAALDRVLARWAAATRGSAVKPAPGAARNSPARVAACWAMGRSNSRPRGRERRWHQCLARLYGRAKPCAVLEPKSSARSLPDTAGQVIIRTRQRDVVFYAVICYLLVF